MVRCHPPRLLPAVLLVALAALPARADTADAARRAEAAAARAEAAAERAEAAAARTEHAIERLERLIEEFMRRESARSGRKPLPADRGS